MKLYRHDSFGKLRPVRNWEWKVARAIKRKRPRQKATQ